MMRINQKLSPSAFWGIAINKQRSNVRIRQGDFDMIEREEGGNYQKTLKKCLWLFESNCQKNEVSIDVTQHVIDLLQDVLKLKYIANELRIRGNC